ncbi:MAG: hypothetical protein J0M24_13815 [Verrucomicrobia bacterium]|nr:hypothetical protein [Verrucomicrobiota bacterium]
MRSLSSQLSALSLLLFPAAALAICLTIPTAPGGPVAPPSTNGTEVAASMLPIEVLGEPGTIATVTAYVTNGSTADTLYLQAYNLSYEGKASIQINGGDWVSLTDDNVTYPRLEAAFFGMGSAFDTLRFTVAATNFVDGTNTLSFRFNDADQKTIGYRILDLQIRQGTTNRLRALPADNPALWTPLTSDPAAINAGSNAWFYGTIMERGTNLFAKCTDCHHRTGRDLKYFNFSDKSIIERSVFHGLTRETSTNLAAYIRSLNIPYEANARPWNPPYQPAPGLDALPVRSWAAGGTLAWVLDDDTNALSYIFPSGITTNALDLTNGINAREIPLGIQFPSWNKWLPKIHPLDQDPAFYATNAFHTIYPTIRSNLAGKSGAIAAAYFEGQSSPWDAAGKHVPLAKPATSDPLYATWAQWERDRRHWRVVKVWEIMQDWALEEYGDNLTIFPAVPNGASQSKRRWFHGEVFRLGPHVVGTPKTEAFAPESAQWYQLQLVLNDGNRRNGSIVPIDWGYQHALNQDTWRNPTNFVTYGTLVLNVIKGTEVGVNGIPIGTTHSWHPTKADQWRLANQYLGARYALIPVELRRAVAEAVMVPWLRHAETFSRSQLDVDSVKFQSMSNLLAYNLVWLPTLGVDTNIVNRVGSLKTNLFH